MAEKLVRTKLKLNVAAYPGVGLGAIHGRGSWEGAVPFETSVSFNLFFFEAVGLSMMSSINFWLAALPPYPFV